MDEEQALTDFKQKTAALENAAREFLSGRMIDDESVRGPTRLIKSYDEAYSEVVRAYALASLYYSLL